MIGKGSFGKVYLATHKFTNGSKVLVYILNGGRLCKLTVWQVVLKSAHKDDANLAREIHHHRQFLHPHIARLYEVIVTETLVWLVLEYCPGKYGDAVDERKLMQKPWETGDELYHHLLQSGPLEPPKVQKIFTQLVGAVSYVHSKSCVHRDLKLENILLDKHENVKLVDFGFTREYEGKASYLQTWCGTICYSAPEMIKGEKYAGEKVDVWSLGIILYALLCGELPFDDDEEAATKAKILKEEPKYPEHMPQGAKDLIVSLLSKRPLVRPTLSDILTNPWLADHAPQQQAILKLQQPAPFTTELEKDTLQRMRSAGVDIDQLIENVLAQRCDALAGWWALLLEKEERKEKRRQRKRKEREAESKSARRLSAASSRLERLAPTIRETDAENHRSTSLGDPPKSRGRNMNRLSGASINSTGVRRWRDSSGDLQNRALPELPKYVEPKTPDQATPPPPIEKDSVRSDSSSRHRPPLPPKEARRSRSSMLQHVSTNRELLSPNGFVPKKRRKYQQPILNQLASLKHWFKESAKRARSPHSKSTASTSPKAGQGSVSSTGDRRSSKSGQAGGKQTGGVALQAGISFPSLPLRPRVSTTASGGSAKRPSLSPSPVTPRSSYRRSSTGLRGRKSTSSSVSSIRSIHHHHHTHSKASSTSSASASLASPSASATGRTTRSPPTSVKVLPATPVANVFPSNIRVVRTSGSASESRAAFGGLAPPSPGLVFAKRRRSPFKGPMLMMPHSRGASESGGSRSESMQGRRSGEIIEEEEEDEFEEVEAFSPVLGPDEEFVQELPVPEHELDPPAETSEAVRLSMGTATAVGLDVGTDDADTASRSGNEPAGGARS